MRFSDSTSSAFNWKLLNWRRISEFHVSSSRGKESKWAAKATLALWNEKSSNENPISSTVLKARLTASLATRSFTVRLPSRTTARPMSLTSL